MSLILHDFTLAVENTAAMWCRNHDDGQGCLPRPREPRNRKFNFIEVDIKHGRPVAPPNATSCYLRYSEFGKSEG